MIAFVTTIGEPTTDLCVWALKRNNFEVHTVSGDTSLATKLKDIYQEAYNLGVDFLRVDADVIVNRTCTPEFVERAANTLPDAWWVQFQCWGWYSQATIYGGVQYVKQQALLPLLENIERFENTSRPETALSRISEFYGPRRFQSYEAPLGIHGYGIKNLKPIIVQKANRGQSANYDFELAQKLNEL